MDRRDLLQNLKNFAFLHVQTVLMYFVCSSKLTSITSLNGRNLMILGTFCLVAKSAY